MTIRTRPREAATIGPRWDGRRMLFEILDGDRRVSCAISLTALQDMSERRRFKRTDLLLCFAQARDRIEALALRKHRARPDHGSNASTPRWVYVSGITVMVLVLLFAVLHLPGGGLHGD